VGAGLFSGRARLRIKFLVAAARRPALHIAPALRTAADLGVGCGALRQYGAGKMQTRSLRFSLTSSTSPGLIRDERFG
jgi:hypothetical protein